MNLGEILRDEGMERVDAATPTEWKETTADIILHLAQTKQTFTTDDVWERVTKPLNPRALGPVMKLAQKSGWIEPTSEFISSKRPVAHARPVRVWRSLIYTGAE